MKINYKTCNFIAIIVALLVVLMIARYLALENNNMGKELQTTQNSLQIVQSELDATKNELITAQESLSIETEKSIGLSEALGNTIKELEIANTTIANLKNVEYELVYLGSFKLTHYCVEEYEHICGNGDGLTAIGTNIIPEKTVAVDPTIIPYGTEIYIEGHGWRVVEDCGGAVKGKHIDIAVDTHSNAINAGIQNGGVWIVIEKTS